jgi:hypothetical protein|tara:strand:- start:478 stop:1038 length:561 start_codon:yes stop_codon:yes gene_type:complete
MTPKQLVIQNNRNSKTQGAKSYSEVRIHGSDFLIRLVLSEFLKRRHYYHIMRPFHLAFPVDNLDKTREFYTTILGCKEGRSSDRWIDFDMYGHQVVAHLVDELETVQTNPVDGDNVPASHFGVILEINDWNELAKRLTESGIKFIIEPHIRFKGESGEQATMFFLDPCGNALEFKSFNSGGMIFAK